MVDPAPLPFAQDPALLVEVCAQLLAAGALAAAVAEGCGGLRYSDGFVFQHLVPGPLGVTALASKLGITQQGASKSVADLERRGFVAREVDPGDERSRLVSLTDRGWLAVRAARRFRLQVRNDLAADLGAEDAEAFTVALGRLAGQLGGFEALDQRSLRPPT